LDALWDRERVQLLALTGAGGMGKTALVRHWLTGMGDQGWRGAEGVFDWSFAGQGSDRPQAADACILAALAFFGDADPAAGNAYERGHRLARLVAAGRNLLVLDGLEPLLYAAGPQAGLLRDAGLAALLQGLAEGGHGLCILTSRTIPQDLEPWQTRGYARLELAPLAPAAGAELLASRGVGGSPAEREAAAQALGGQPLALRLLAGWLVELERGEARRHTRLPSDTEAEPVRRLLAAWEGRLAPREAALLRLSGLLERPLGWDELVALLASPRLPGVNDRLHGGRGWGLLQRLGLGGQGPLAPAQLEALLARLQGLGLLVAHDRTPPSLDAHPLVRAYQSERLQQDLPAWQAAHLRLYEYLRDSAPPRPSGEQELLPLYRALSAGCRAGQAEAAWDWLQERRPAVGAGAAGAELAALAACGEPSWGRPIPGLRAEQAKVLLERAALGLRAQGRLAEATGPAATLRDLAATAGAPWEWAIRAGQLAALYLSQGELAAASAAAREALAQAGRSGDPFYCLSRRALLAQVLHQAGERDQAGVLFQEAEVIQAQDQPQHPRLYFLPGVQYCDWLLAPAELAAGSLWLGRDGDRTAALDSCLQVQERAAYSLAVAQRLRWSLHLGLGHLWIARSRVLQALLGGAEPEEARGDLARAAALLSSAAPTEPLAWVWLTRAAWHRCRARTPAGLDQWQLAAAARDLTAAEALARRGPLALLLADCALERARLALCDPERPDRATALSQLAAARRWVGQQGYRRREAELAELEQQLR
jgi:hypothetical protein